MNNRMTKGIVALLSTAILAGCAPGNSVQETALSESQTQVASLAATKSEAIPVGFTYETGPDGRIVVTGMTKEGIPVSARILANRDIQNPGEGSSYTVQMTPFDETDREAFVKEDWTIVEERSEPYYGDPQYPGTSYFDTWLAKDGETWKNCVLPSNMIVFSARGGIIASMASGRGPYPTATEQLSFSSPEEAYQQARDVLAAEGFTVSDCYEISQVPYTWLQQGAKLSAFYGDDMTEYDQVFPDGFSTEDNAYYIDLRREIDGLPVLTAFLGTPLVNGERPEEKEAENSSWSMINAWVTNKGVEKVAIHQDFTSADKVETGAMIGFEQALQTVSQNFLAAGENDGLYQTIYSNSMGIGLDEVETTASPIATGIFQPVRGTVEIERAELGLLLLTNRTNSSGRAIPCWVFEFAWSYNGSIQQQCWAAVNALTGEYIPTTTSTGEEI